ncbi:MAG: TIGR02281 family clan AA aspartic protease [Rhodocyclaceae bacterium]|jgi:aspartyl protease family protein|nr:TIGR02281 family clan AA aspartic protease [Rhodocyclaceae bacterium]
MARERRCLVLLLCALSFGALAADIALVGLLPGKALVVIDDGKRQTIAVGATTPEGVKLLALESGGAVFEIAGKSRRVALGQSIVSAPGAERPATTMIADSRGHFVVPGSINGVPMRFLVDTGATFISLGAADARRARIDVAKGTPGTSMTANGPVRVWLVRLESVKLGGITLRDVDASVHEQDMPVVLLGMSFLNRMEIHRDGSSMTLTQRY